MRKFTVKMKAGDGSTYHAERNTLAAAMTFIDNAAFLKAEELATSEWDNFFPMYWEIIRNEDLTLVDKGFVDETGFHF